ncbi:YqjF family protein [Parafrankia sp. FMc2]|uniref:YqjF family protein n=1 Tax=Parafrankia sp. FMc2 TaxID=3233196 RepID=UPI0034D3A98B
MHADETNLAGVEGSVLPASDRPTVGPVCPFTVERPASLQRWERLTFVHWPFEPDRVRALLPPELEVDVFDGRAWVSLVPFSMRVATGRGWSVPWASTFPETNVRTYVVDRLGRRGVWFFSLDAARLGAVLVARSGYRLPYLWSAMTLSGADGLPAESGPRLGPGPGPGEVRYGSRRRWPGPRGASCQLRVRIGVAYRDDELGPLDHFLTARWRLYSATGLAHRAIRASHDPWPLYRAQVAEFDDGLLRAAGLTPPPGDPLAHYSPGVDVRIGRPEQYLL